MELERWYYRIRAGLRMLFLRRRVEDELAAELRDHLDRETADQVTTRGVSPTEARRRAGARLHVEAVKERCRELRPTRWLEDFWTDGRVALRGFGRDPAPVSAAVATRGPATATPQDSGRWTDLRRRPNARPMSLTDSPRFHRLQTSAFSAADMRGRQTRSMSLP